MKAGGIGVKKKENLSYYSVTQVGDKIAVINLQKKQSTPAEGSFQELSAEMAGYETFRIDLQEKETENNPAVH
jgi:hypothetical protein